MKKRTEKREMKDELRREYDLTKLKGGIRGKYVTRYRTGTNLVLLSPEIAKYFPDEVCEQSAAKLDSCGERLNEARDKVNARRASAFACHGSGKGTDACRAL